MSYAAAAFEAINLGRSEQITLCHAIRAIAGVSGVRSVIDSLPGQAANEGIAFADSSIADRLLYCRKNVGSARGVADFLDWLHRDDHASRFTVTLA